MCLYYEYVVFDFEFFGFVFDFEFFLFVFNFEFFGGKKTKKKKKTYSRVFKSGLKLVYSRVSKNTTIGQNPIATVTKTRL